MRKDKTNKNSPSCLKRTKIIFFVIAVTMCLSLFAMSYKYTTRGIYAVFSNGMTIRADPANQANEIREQIITAKKTISEGLRENLKVDGIFRNDISASKSPIDVINNTGDKSRVEDVTFSNVILSSSTTSATSTAGFEEKPKMSMSVREYQMVGMGENMKRNDSEDTRREPTKAGGDFSDLHETGSFSPDRLTNKISVQNNKSTAMKTSIGAMKRRYDTFKNLRQHLIQLGGLQAMHSNKMLDTVDNSKPSDATVRPDVCAGCFKLDFKVLIDEPKLCDGKVKLLMLITSKISNPYQRDAVRETWGAVCNKPTSGIKCLFLFGNRNDSEENQALFKEHQAHHDIFQCDFYDVYANLTYKTMMGLQWASQRCPQAKYVMKTDDDMYVNTELLPTMLQGAPDKKFMGGHCWGPSSPHRDTNSKWYVSYEQYTHSFFPRMCSGTGYVMSQDVAVGVVKMSADIPFFYLEDVYVAICVKKLGFQPVQIVGFNNMLVEFEPCKYRNRILTTHGVSVNGLVSIWKRLKMCPKEDLKPSMVYAFRYI